MKKAKILVFNRVYLPGFRAGGPIRSIANLVESLGDEFDFYVVTKDRDSGMLEPYSEAALGNWVHMGKAYVRYLEESRISVRRIIDIFNEIGPDAVILNSFFDPVFTQRVLLARRLRRTGNARFLLAPRGEFSPGALDLKRAKKQLYLIAAKLSGFYRGLMWQASSDDELNLIRKCILKPPADNVFVARNIGTRKSVTKKAGRYQRSNFKGLRIVFLSRVVPMKNLDFALQILADARVPVEFSIYGPIEDGKYWEKCQNLIEKLPTMVSVHYGGEVEPERVHSVLAGNDLFFLPTRGENFGHVIHEALQAGLPVLISDQTPWDSNTLRDAGWAVALDQRGEFVRILQRLAESDPLQRRRMSEAATSVISTLHRLHGDIESNRKLLDLLVSNESAA